MVVKNLDTMRLTNTFKGKFSFNRRASAHITCHEVDIRKIREIINKNSGNIILLSSGSSAESWDTSRNWTDELIHTDNLTGTSCYSESLAVVNTLPTPWFSMRFSVGTSRANHRINICQIFGDKASAGH